MGQNERMNWKGEGEAREVKAGSARRVRRCGYDEIRRRGVTCEFINFPEGGKLGQDVEKNGTRGHGRWRYEGNIIISRASKKTKIGDASRQESELRRGGIGILIIEGPRGAADSRQRYESEEGDKITLKKLIQASETHN
eukprot:752993-Hanusia_phi.AAC.5